MPGQSVGYPCWTPICITETGSQHSGPEAFKHHSFVCIPGRLTTEAVALLEDGADRKTTLWRLQCCPIGRRSISVCGSSLRECVGWQC